MAQYPYNIYHHCRCSDKGSVAIGIRSSGITAWDRVGYGQKEHFFLRRLCTDCGQKPYLGTKDTDGARMHV